MKNEKSHKAYKPYYLENRLKSLRKEKGYIQRDIAELLDHSIEERVCNWEKGRAVPSIVNLFRLSVIYGLYPHELYPELFHHITQEVILKRMEFRKENLQ
jgi:transcriptional regulator with XRE-family HTH domain